jgi:hypothetical protein
MLAGLACAPAMADETVSIGGSRAVLIKPKAPHASVILMPGGDGNIRPGDQGDIQGLTGNQLVRTRHAYAARGLAVLVVDASTDLNSAVQYMAAIKRPVTVIGTSLGTIRAAEGIARGARPDALELGPSGDLTADVADDPTEPAAQQAQLAMVALELLGMGIARSHHRRALGDAQTWRHEGRGPGVNCKSRACIL